MVYVKQMVFACAVFFIWSVCPGITAPCLGAESSSSLETRVSALGQVRVFGRLDADQLRKVAEIAEMVAREKGDRIIQQGKRAGQLAVALDSEVQIRIDGETIRVLPPNSLVGEIEFLDDVPATADVVLMHNSRVILLKHTRFQQVMDADPNLGYRVMVEIATMEARRLRISSQRKAR